MKSIQLQIATPEDFPQIAQLIGALNNTPAQRCLHCATSEKDVLAELKDHHSRLELRFVVAYQADELIAVLGCDCDATFDRIWFWGPFIQPNLKEQWSDIAEQLYRFFLQKTPNAKQLYAYKHIDNQWARTLFHSKGFKDGPNEIYEYQVTQLAQQPTRLTNYQTIRYQKKYYDALDQLHNSTFPDTYYSTKEMVELDSQKNRIYLSISTDNQELVGYLLASVQATNNGYIHFLGVIKNHRRQGIGKHLLLTALQWLLQEETLPSTKLTVASINNARKLYESVGFSLLHTGIGSKLILDDNR